MEELLTSKLGNTLVRLSKMPMMPSMSATGTEIIQGFFFASLKRYSPCSLADQALPGPAEPNSPLHIQAGATTRPQTLFSASVQNGKVTNNLQFHVSCVILIPSDSQCWTSHKGRSHEEGKGNQYTVNGLFCFSCCINVGIFSPLLTC